MKHSRWQVFGALAVLIFAFMLSRGLYHREMSGVPNEKSAAGKDGYKRGKPPDYSEGLCASI